MQTTWCPRRDDPAACVGAAATHAGAVTSTTVRPGAALDLAPRTDSVAEAEHMADRHLARTAEVERVRGVVHWLDDMVRIPGTRFGVGLDAILGAVVPGLGDAVTGAVSITVLVTALRRGVPRIVVARMFVNLLVDVVVGMVPVVGDVFDLFWRSNVRNLALLERHQGELEPRARPGDYAVVAAAVALVVASVAAPIMLVAWVLSAIF
jgi:hypothetical protein